MVAAVMIMVGCTETPRQPMGAAVDNDQNVLTGGPITGTTIEDLPMSVKDTLKELVPQAEIASIEKVQQGGHVIYDITFIDSANPEMYLRDDGKVVPEPARTQ